MEYRQVVAELSCLAQKVISSVKEAAKSNQQFGEISVEVLAKVGRDFWTPTLDEEHVLGSVMERYVDAVLYLFAAEIGGQVSAIMDMQGVKEAGQEATKTGELLHLYNKLHELARPEDVFDREQEVAARKLAPYFSISWRKNALVFSMNFLASMQASCREWKGEAYASPALACVALGQKWSDAVAVAPQIFILESTPVFTFVQYWTHSAPTEMLSCTKYCKPAP